MALLGACASVASEPASVASEPVEVSTQHPAFGASFTLHPGEAVEVGTERVRVRFDAVPQDSRCPRDVQCIRAGDATVRLTVTTAGQRDQTVNLRTTPAGAVATVGAYAVTLSDLAPARATTEEIREADYRASLSVTTAPR